MKFEAKIGEKELKVLAWLLEHKTKMRNTEFYKGVLLTCVVLLVCIYDMFFYSEATSAQKWILIIMTIACAARTIACKLGKQDYMEIARHKNRKMIGKAFVCTFNDDSVEIDDGKRTETMKYDDLDEWGEYNGCIYLLFSKGAVIVLDKAKQEEKSIERLREKFEKMSN